MKKKLIVLFLPTLFAGFITACSTTNEPSEAYKGQSTQQIFAEGKKSLVGNNYSDAIKHFEALDVQYPYGKETERAQLYLIYAYYMKEDYALSVAASDRFIRLHPTNPNVDYAYYMRGIANYKQSIGILERIFSVDLATRDLQLIKKSYASFNELLIHFPRSVYAAATQQYLVYLRNIIADHELQVGQYYYDRQAYTAAANRASNVVAHYQGSPAVVNALALMAKSYHQLGLTKLEQDALLVLKYNYPDAKVIVTS